MKKNTYGYHQSMANSNKQNRQKNFYSYFKIIYVPKALSFIIILGGLFLLVGHFMINKIVKDIASSVTYIPEQYEKVISSNDESFLSEDYVTNILLIATDKRSPADPGRADVLLLLSYNESDNHLNLCSFQRDLYLQLYFQGMTNRLNSSFTYGGPECTVKTIEQNFNIDIDHWIVLDMYSAHTFIDAIGGLEIEITPEEASYINAYLNEINLINGYKATDSYLDENISGKQILNGRQALSYCRIRYLDGDDYGRTNRQRKTIEAIITKMGKIAFHPHLLITAYNNLLDSMEYISTDMDENDMKSLLKRMSLVLGAEHFSYSIPVDTTWEYKTTDSGMKVITCDLEENYDFLRKKLY